MGSNVSGVRYQFMLLQLLLTLRCYLPLFVFQVQGVLRMLQGFSSSLFNWDPREKSYFAKTGIYVTHLTQTSLLRILNQFMHAATCLQLVEMVINEVETSLRLPPPTLRAFACSVSSWLKVCI